MHGLVQVAGTECAVAEESDADVVLFFALHRQGEPAAMARWPPIIVEPGMTRGRAMSMMRRVARIARRKRAVHELANLLSDTHAHADHRAAGAKRRNDRVAFLQRQAAADGDGFLALARKSLRGNLPFMLPADQCFFEDSRDEHVVIETPFETISVDLNC